MDARSLLKLTLRPGSVYYFQERSLTSVEPHYFIVINARPAQRQILVLSVVTLKIERVKRLRHNLPGTLVEIDPKQYDELKLRSIVDCNVVFVKPLSDLEDMIRRKDVRHHNDLPTPILAAIQKAVKDSPLVDDETKKLLD